MRVKPQNAQCMDRFSSFPTFTKRSPVHALIPPFPAPSPPLESGRVWDGSDRGTTPSLTQRTHRRWCRVVLRVENETAFGCHRCRLSFFCAPSRFSRESLRTVPCRHDGVSSLTSFFGVQAHENTPMHVHVHNTTKPPTTLWNVFPCSAQTLKRRSQTHAGATERKPGVRVSSAARTHCPRRSHGRSAWFTGFPRQKQDQSPSRSAAAPSTLCGVPRMVHSSYVRTLLPFRKTTQ